MNFLLCCRILIPITSLFYLYQANALALNLPKITDVAHQFKYVGAFKMYGGVKGTSKLNNSEAIFDINDKNNTFYITSHSNSASCFVDKPDTRKHSIAELSIPDLVNSTNLTDLNEAPFVQDFSVMLDDSRISYFSYYKGSRDCQNLITGIKYVNGKLLLNTMNYYDSTLMNTDTSLVVENASDLSNSPIYGFFQVKGAAHTSRWISDIPSVWQPLLGGRYLYGNANNYPRNDRQSYGPSAFVVDPSQMTKNNLDQGQTHIDAVKLIDYSVSKIEGYLGYGGTGQYIGALNPDFFNIKGTNKLWTEKSKAVYGFIVPGTSTYMVVGSSGGHNSRICYKNTYKHTLEAFNNGTLAVMDNGCKTVRTGPEYSMLSPEEQAVTQECGGYCIVDPSDRHNYYWLYDVQDMLKVKQGKMKPGEVKPYKVGIFNVPFQKSVNGEPQFHPITSASYDRLHDRLYLTLFKAGPGSYDNNRPPVMVVYQIDTKRPKSPTALTIQ